LRETPGQRLIAHPADFESFSLFKPRRLELEEFCLSVNQQSSERG
jgi:hypothetical protein